jgi:hypothetical protein
LKADKEKLMKKLEEVSEYTRLLKRIMNMKLKKTKFLKMNSIFKDKDIWTSLKSRLGSKKDGEGE